MGPTIDELVVGDPPDVWADAGFTMDADGVCRIGTVRVRLAGPEGGRHIRSWSVRGIDPDTDDIDGLATRPSETTAAAAEPGRHPNGVRSIDHLVVLTSNMGRTVSAVERLGIEPRRTREVDPDQYGFAAHQTFFRFGEVVLELIGPAEPSEESDRPARFFGLAFTVDDLDALPDRFGEHLGRIKDAVQPGRRIATLRHKQLGLSVGIAFMTPGDAAV